MENVLGNQKGWLRKKSCSRIGKLLETLLASCEQALSMAKLQM